MKIKTVKLHNFRSFLDAAFELRDYSLLVGANNAGKSNIIHALLIFYEKKSWSSDDFPKVRTEDNESWIEICYELSNDEWKNIKDAYKREDRLLYIRKCLKSDQRDRVKPKQSNLYAVINEQIEDNLFYGAKNIGQDKLGDVIHIPSVTIPDETLKTTGPSPLRDILTFLLKRSVQKSDAFIELNSAVESFNKEARKENGFISEIETPLNKALEDWNILLRLNIQQISPENIVRQLIHHSFQDVVLDDKEMPLDFFGQGFQRSLIYELLRLLPKYHDIPVSEKKEFRTDFVIILFEEPEAFLHPHQQETMFFNLRAIGAQDSQQVLITTHSPLFVSRASDDLTQIVRIQKIEGKSFAYQVTNDRLSEILQGWKLLNDCLNAFINDPAVPEGSKRQAKSLVSNPPPEEIQIQDELFNYQLWLDSDRSAMFFSDHVVLVEGPSDRVLFNYLLNNEWQDLRRHRVYVLDTFGKYNIPRFMTLLESFGIRHGVLIDGDENRDLHIALNSLIVSCVNFYTVKKPYILARDIEDFLGLQKSEQDRRDRKPLEILKSISNKKIDSGRILKLREVFEKHLLGL